MKEMRMLGNYVGYLAKRKGLTSADLSNLFDTTEDNIEQLLRGRRFLSWDQLVHLASVLDVSVDELLVGDEDLYNATVVHCCGAEINPNNREFVLNIIDDYLDVAEAASGY